MPLSQSKKGVAVLLLGVLGAGLYVTREYHRGPPAEAAHAATPEVSADDAARLAYESHTRGRVITVSGKVERILADDRDGSPHQRFIIRTPTGVSVLIAHNLDLAPRLEGLAPGETVTVLGEYEWNDKGGVMHWTHDDPQGRHETGYIEWRGRRYQ